MQSRKQFFLVITVGIGVALGIIVLRLLLDSRSAVHAGAEAEARGDATLAIRHYHAAARLYFPGSPYVKRALSRLDAIALTAIQQSNYPLGRKALEAERAALLETRSFYIPHSERLPEIERRLSRLLAAVEDPGLMPGASFETRSKWHLDRLSRRPAPRGIFVALSYLGLAGWLGASVLFFKKGLDSQLHLRPIPAILTGIAFLVGFGLFLMGLRLA